VKILTTLVTLAALAAPLAAQTDKATALADWQRTKDNVLHYVDAMPDSLMSYRPTPGVRTFAQQIDHIVQSNHETAAMAVRGLASGPVLGDSTRYFTSRAALHDYVASSFDYVIASIRAATPQQWTRRSSMYEQPQAPASRWLQLALEHSVWTLGQVVPYMRLNHVTPPSYSMPF
jgi:hypothetical protein